MAKIPRPEGHHTITPGFQTPGAIRVLEFLQKAFGGKVVDRFDGPGGTLAHCEVMLGDSVIMFGDGMPGEPARPANLSYYVDDGAAVDATYKSALSFGAKSINEPKNQFYGYRTAQIEDVGGNRWTICAVVEKVTHEEMERRMAEMMKGGG